ncbi:hypothetical protein VTK73DRAFT_5801 [Phialemonium thermophilum]|uniref:Uncharacterized protein n=1 Tax=Phialemonium thermophilum TaxID=223376 RepID=A0ABR3WMB1_9PEZI
MALTRAPHARKIIAQRNWEMAILPRLAIQCTRSQNQQENHIGYGLGMRVRGRGAMAGLLCRSEDVRSVHDIGYATP